MIKNDSCIHECWTRLGGQSFFLFGRRGVGKTAWARARFSDALFFDLLDAETYTRLLASPSRLADQIPDGYRGWVVIDEIQRLPELLNEVHRLQAPSNGARGTRSNHLWALAHCRVRSYPRCGVCRAHIDRVTPSPPCSIRSSARILRAAADACEGVGLRSASTCCWLSS